MRFSSIRAMLCAGLQFALICFSPFPLLSQNTVPAASGSAPLLPYGNCAAPTHEGVNICGLGNGVGITSPFQVIAAGTSGRAQVKLMELWIDGKKVTQTNGTPFDEPINMAVGSHELTLIEQDTTGAYVKSARVNVVVDSAGSGNGSCPLPEGPGVKVCSPTPSSCQSSGDTAEFDAAGRGRSGTVSRMELWINGTKIANFPGDRIYTSVLNTFYPTATIMIDEVDSNGGTIASLPIVVGGPC